MAKGEDITTRFKVDVSDLKKGITEANNQIKMANSEFTKASAGMDDWSKSSEGIRAKLQQLTTILSAQNDKLNNYKEQLKRIEEAEKKASDEVSRLKTELDKAKKTYGENSSEVKKLQTQLTSAEKAEMQLKTQIANATVTMNNQEATVTKTEKEMNKLEVSLKDVEEAEKKASKSGKSVEEELQNMDDASKNAQDGFTVLKGALANLVADGFRKAIDAAKEFATEMLTTAANVKAENAMFEQTFGDMGDAASDAIKRVADSSGILETRLNTTGARLYAFARSNGGETAESLQLMEEALQATADSAAYYDKSLDETAETMMSFLKGNFANDAALGISATEFTRNAKATELFGKKYLELTEFQKQQTLLKMVTDAQKVSGAFGQASRESDGWENVMGNLKETWRQFQARVGTPFLEALIPVIQEITKSFTEWADSVNWDVFGRKVKKFISNIISGIKSLISVVGNIISFVKTFKPLIIGLGTAILAYVTYSKLATTSTKLFNAALKANPAGLVISAIAGLIAGFKTLIDYENKETKALKEKSEAIKAETEATQELIKSRQDLHDSVEESISNGLAELDYVQDLKSELDNLVDANGKVKEGYENRANFIIGQLSEATGVEISLIDGQIQKYNELSKTIDAIIEKKKAELILEANEDLYKDAIKNRQNAYNEISRLNDEIASTYSQMMDKLDEAQRYKYDWRGVQANKQYKQLQDQYDNLMEQYHAQQDLADDNAYIIGAYEKQMVDFQKGAYENIISNDINLTEHKRNKNLTDKEIAEKNLEIAKLEYGNLLMEQQEATDDQKALYDQQIENAKKNVEEKQQVLDSLTSTVATGNENVAEAWETGIANQLSSMTSRNIEFKDAGNGQVQMYVDGVKTGKPMAENEMRSLAEDSIQQIKDKKMDAQTAGEYLLDGINKGISNKAKKNKVLESVWGFGIDIINQFRSVFDTHSPSKKTDKLGQQLLEGIGVGVKKKSNPILNQVSGFGKNLLSTLQDQLNNNVELNEFKNRLEVGLDNAKSGLSNMNNSSFNENNSRSNNSTTNNVINNFTQNINAPKQPSRIELYRQTRNLLALKGGN